MESVLGRVVVMVVVGVIGGTVAILFVRAESQQRKATQVASGAEGEGVLPGTEQSINETLRDAEIITEKSVVPEVPFKNTIDDTLWDQNLPYEDSQLEPATDITSQMAYDLEEDGGFLDELILAIQRRISYLDGDEGIKRRKRNIKKIRKKRYVGEEKGENWIEEMNNDKETGHTDKKEKSTSSMKEVDHRIRHSRRKAYHRNHKIMTTPPEITTYNHNTGSRDPAIIQKETPKIIFHPVNKFNSNPDFNKTTKINELNPNMINSRFNNLTNVNIMGNITHIKTPLDIMKEDSHMATEIREALLLAIPLSLLLTVVLLVCVAFCCCRYRYRLAYNDYVSYNLREEDQDYDQESPAGDSMGICEGCLPGISYHDHRTSMINTKRIMNKKKQPYDQMELVVDAEAIEVHRDEGIKCHPPLYALLSNLPPGSSNSSSKSHLDEDEEESPFRSFRSKEKPRRSQSLEFLTV